MIIVSQSKRMILNFNSLVGLGLSSLEDKSIAIKMYETNDRVGTTIARYATEKRAQEILQEITEEYEKCNMDSSFGQYAYVQNRVYEMPAE